jgi:dTDP-4-amino-4,6-dideoxy-D-galactose acyltransferase
MIEYLNWDSHFFNLKIGKVETNSLSLSLFQSILISKEKENYDLVYLFTEKIEKEADEELKKKQFFPVDNKIVFAKKVDQQAAPPENIQSYTGELNASLLDLALLSGHKSRFQKDNRLNHKFELLYRLWIQKSLTGEMADAVLVTKQGNNIEGFVTVQKKELHGQIGLIAVAPEAQGKGIGSKLIQAAESWHSQNNLKTCSVVTQLDNSGACRLYEKSGYSKEKIELVFHI